MLRKLIVFAITSGLAGKLYRSFKDGRRVARTPAQAQPRRPVSDLPPV
jgi:hypothetical protein